MELQPNDFRRMSVEEFDTTKLLAHASKQAKARGYDKFPIVDVDSHHYENESMSEILEYLDDPVLRQLALAGSKPNAKNARILNTMVGYQDMGGRITRYALRGLEKAPGTKDERHASERAFLAGRPWCARRRRRPGTGKYRRRQSLPRTDGSRRHIL